MRLLVTGFGPFRGVRDNPSARLAAESGLPARVLEVSWGAVREWLDAPEADEFDALLHLGHAPRARLSLELLARNRRGPEPDARGAVEPGEIEPGGPAALRSSLWSESLVGRVLPSPVARLSYDAGAYLCNGLAYASQRRRPAKAVGFLHVPPFERVPIEAQVAFVRRVAEALSAPL